MVDPVTLNARKPGDNAYGLAMLNRMNERHQQLYQWGLEHISVEKAGTILDIGFGGGQNIKNMANQAPNAKIYGIDYSQASYNKCAELNRDAIEKGKISIQVGSAENIPYDAQSFDVVTAFETVYYWPNIQKCFRDVYRTLKDNGTFLICNEDCSSSGIEEIADALNMNFYDLPDLENLLRQAGFSKVNTQRHSNGKWVCAVGIR